MKRIIVILWIFLIVGPVSATVYYIPDDYSTVQEGMEASVDGDTVLVRPGTWDDNVYFDGKSILLSSTQGPDTTTLRYIFFSGDEDSLAVLRGFEIGKIIFQSAGGSPIILGNEITRFGHAIIANRSSPIIRSNYIHHNIINSFMDANVKVGRGTIIEDNIMAYNRAWSYDFDVDNECGAVLSRTGGINLSYNLFARNSVDPGFSTALNIDYGVNIVENNTFVLNYGFLYEGIPWTAIILCEPGSILRNNIFYGSEKGLGFAGNLDSITAGYNLFYQNDLNFSSAYSLQEGDLIEDPLFIDPENDNFHIQASSPCIDAGDPNSPLDPDSTRADIGCYYYNQSTDITETDKPSGPHTFYLKQNYPNPFNGQTIISYYLDEEAYVELNIINMRGELVAKPVDSRKTSGDHSLIWPGTRTDGTPVSTGIYFYELKVSGASSNPTRDIKAMILLK